MGLQFRGSEMIYVNVFNFLLGKQVGTFGFAEELQKDFATEEQHFKGRSLAFIKVTDTILIWDRC